MNEEDKSKAAPPSIAHEINDLLFHAVVNLEFGLRVIKGETGLSAENQQALLESLSSAHKSTMAVADVVRRESVFLMSSRCSEEEDSERKPELSTEENEEASSQGDQDTWEKLKVDHLEVLLLDDEFRMGRVFQRILKERANVKMATTVRDAWRLVEEQSFDVIFCDVHLPKVSGIDFFRDLVEQKPEQAKRVIFITGGLYSEESQELVREVENPVVYKPFEIKAIEDALDEVLF